MATHCTLLMRLTAASCFLWLASGLAAQTDRPRLSLTDPPDRLTGRDLPARRNAVVGGPLLGYVWDTREGLAAILGVPGAAGRGAGLLGSGDIVSAAISAERGYALLIAGEEGRLLIARGLASAVSVNPVTAAPLDIRRVVLSPSGSAAVLVTGDSLTVMDGLPDEARVAWQTGAQSLPGEPVGLALRDDGAAVLVAAADGEGLSILAGGRDGDWRYVTRTGPRASLSFFRGEDNAVVADAEANQVILIRGVSTGGLTQVVATEADGITGPVAVAVSDDNRRLVVAVTEPGGVVSIGLADGHVDRTACGCTPAALERWNGNAVFRLTAAGEGPLWVYDGDAGQPRLVVVPPRVTVSASALETAGGGQ